MLGQLLLFAAVGFIAQLIDGALGMAYGVSSTTFLLTVGVAPAVASACVHASEVATTAVSGLAHFRLGNIDKQLFARLVIPGVLGGIAGAYLLNLEALGTFLKPFISLYLIIMGLVILSRALRKAPEREVTRETARARALIPLVPPAASSTPWAAAAGAPSLPHHCHRPWPQPPPHHRLRQRQRILRHLRPGHHLRPHHPRPPRRPLAHHRRPPLRRRPRRPPRRLRLPPRQPRAMMIIVGCVIIALSLRTLILAWA